MKNQNHIADYDKISNQNIERFSI